LKMKIKKNDLINEEELSSREIILKKISDILCTRTSETIFSEYFSHQIYREIAPDMLTCFMEEIKAVSGECFVYDSPSNLFVALKKFLLGKGFSKIHCRNEKITEYLKSFDIPFSSSEADFEIMEVGITDCEFLVARTGSVIVSSFNSGRKMNIFPPVHIVIAHRSQLVSYLDDAYRQILQKYKNNLPSLISTITGPSRTSDIEKTLVLGAHGPKQLLVFLLDN